ncbi:MAG: hypothetical protein MUE53_06245 [Chitinophagales bacterium]|jgi:hypothetical protein|nr:hypothetical protein [Chitinophagales bacterium]
MFKKWYLKAIVQKFISFLPFSQEFNYFFQRFITQGITLRDYYFYDRLLHAKNHIASFKKHAKVDILSKVVELGSGWHPIIPISFFLIGSEQIITFDIHNLITKKTLAKTIGKFLESYEKGILNDYLEVLPEKIALLKKIILNYDTQSFEEILESIHIVYLVQETGIIEEIKENSIDLIVSNNTLEHISEEELKNLFLQFSLWLKHEKGVMSHFIDMTDHFSHFDTSISALNFLKYSPNQWAWIDNSIQPQNRLRLDDYISIFQDQKFILLEVNNQQMEKAMYETQKIHSSFAHKSEEILLVTHSHIISKLV